MADRDQLLDELARIYARAAVDQFLAEQMKTPTNVDAPPALPAGGDTASILP